MKEHGIGNELKAALSATMWNGQTSLFSGYFYHRQMEKMKEMSATEKDDLMRPYKMYRIYTNSFAQ